MAEFIFKVIVHTKNDKEITMLKMHSKVALTFYPLHDAIRSRTPSLGIKELKLYYRDLDGDMIQLNDSYDMEIFLSLQSLGIKTIHVYTEDFPLGGNVSPQEEHTGVSCDICRKTLKGFRYKCLECPDYDLCQSCEGSGHHPEHVLIRFSKPLSRDFRERRNTLNHIIDNIKFLRREECHFKRSQRNESNCQGNQGCSGESRRNEKSKCDWKGYHGSTYPELIKLFAPGLVNGFFDFISESGLLYTEQKKNENGSRSGSETQTEKPQPSAPEPTPQPMNVDAQDTPTTVRESNPPVDANEEPSVDIGWTIVGDGHSQDKAKPELSPSNNSVPHVVTESAPKVVETPLQQSAGSQTLNLPPSLGQQNQQETPSSSRSPPTQDKTEDNSLENTLKNMGFDCDKEVLRSLVQARNGNIHMVLDDLFSVMDIGHRH